VVTIREVYLLILNPHTHLTTSFISLVSHSNSTFICAQKNENYLGEIVDVFGDKAIEFGDLFNLIW